ncbi:thioredoxin domain-containing protein [Mycolicibacterium sp.]|uniref:DsbA family protein n=1 Tax=Mycolicibacterium sp. TaxID=2320850 RepID=UPI0037CAE3F9
MRRESLGKDLIFIGGLAVVAVALILYLVIDSNPEVAAGGPANADTPPATVVTGSTDAAADSGVAGLAAVERRQPGDPFAMGAADAPVVMVVYSDYRCPFCAKFSRDIQPELVERFVEDGKLRIEWRDYPIFGDQSMLAARAGRAAAEQGKFWEFHDAVYAASPDRGMAELTEDKLIGFAEQAGVPDIDRFTAGMRSDDFDNAINADLAQGNSIGVPSTPAFMINNAPLLGAQPTDEFVSAINQALSNS